MSINLGYTTNAGEHKIHCQLPDGKERAILTGAKVALGIGGDDAFLRYAHRTFGINLTWDDRPSFEWLIYGLTSTKGKPIPTASWAAIVNEKVEPEADFLVYLDLPVGADVGWTTSPDWAGQAHGRTDENGLQRTHESAPVTCQAVGQSATSHAHRIERGAAPSAASLKRSVGEQRRGWAYPAGVGTGHVGRGRGRPCATPAGVNGDHDGHNRRALVGGRQVPAAGRDAPAPSA